MKPYNYEISLVAIFDSQTEPDEFGGVSKIFFRCDETTDHIVLHQGDLDIDESMIKIINLSNGNQLNVSHWEYDEETEIFDLHLNSNLEQGKNYSISMHYSEHIKSNNYGFYKSYYNEKDGNKKWLVASQMESTGARLAFPCFDEPSMKATFKLSVIHHNSLNALSNMPGSSIELYENSNT